MKKLKQIYNFLKWRVMSYIFEIKEKRILKKQFAKLFIDELLKENKEFDDEFKKKKERIEKEFNIRKSNIDISRLLK